MSYIKQMRDYLEDEKRALSKIDLEEVDRLIDLMEKTRKSRGRIFVCGNGGSAATASHFVCDFCKGVSMGLDVKYDLECLSDNTPMLTAVANDIGYEKAFVLPLEAKLSPGDLVIGISGSGNSENVVQAILFAKKKGAATAVLVGFSGGRLLEAADCAVHLPVDNMQIVEDVHMILEHMMMYVLTH